MHWLLHTDEQRSSEIQRRVLLIIGRAIIGIVGRLEPFSQVEFNASVLQRIIKWWLNPAISELVIQQKSGAECNCLSTRKCTYTRGKWVECSYTESHQCRSFNSTLLCKYGGRVYTTGCTRAKSTWGTAGRRSIDNAIGEVKEKLEEVRFFSISLSLSLCVCVCCARAITPGGDTYYTPARDYETTFFFSFFKIG